ncbi:MAG: hypothetical protein DA408_19605 [Bacteroidetes bacterium]|nr:MAG: hypothetical protein C7N36_09325 [Bacteroidota bacterium]PTM08901.1 MAG: hypothetical protein DA408_19605 [Bacteroidota bacterium]
MKYLLSLLLTGIALLLYGQGTFDANYDFAGQQGTDRGANVSDVGDGLMLTTTSYCGNYGCDRIAKLSYTGELLWTFDQFSDDYIFYNPQSKLDIYELNDSSYVALFAVESAATGRLKTSWINFNEHGIIHEMPISDTSQSEAILAWKKYQDVFWTWTNISYEPMLVRKLTPDGTVLFEKLHDEHNFLVEAGSDFAPLPDGGYLYINRFGTGGFNNATMWGRRDSLGEIIWEHLDPLGTRENSVDNIVLTTDNKVIVSYRIQDRYVVENPLADFGGDYIIHCQDLEGNVQWVRPLTYMPYQQVYHIIPAANGDIIGVGEKMVLDWQGTPDEDFIAAWMFRMNAAGEMLWQHHFVPDQPQHDQYTFYDAVELADGRIAAIGYYIDSFPNGLLNADTWLVVTDGNGCIYDECTNDIFVGSADLTVIGAAPAVQGFRLSPNPVATNGTLWLNWPESASHHQSDRLVLYDTNGRVIRQWASADAPENLAMTNLPPGIYQLVLTRQGRRWQTERVLVL